VNRLESLECIKRDAKLFERLNLVLISKYKPKETCEIQNLRRIMEKQFLIPVRMSCVFNEYRHDLVVFIRICVFIE
jgi:hypothetical protein